MPTISPLTLALVLLFTACAGAGEGGQKGERGGPKHVFIGPPPVHPFDVILARPTDRSVTASVLAYEPLEVFLTYGTESGKHTGKLVPRLLKPESPAEFVLKDLAPDTRYFYRLHTKAGTAAAFTPEAEHAFHTQRKPGSPFRFSIQSDSHLDQNVRPGIYEQTLDQALAGQPDFYVDLGDTFMTDKYAAFKDAWPQYMAQRYYFGRIAHSAPLFLVLGNHDGERLDRFDGSAECMAVWSCLARKKLFPNPFPDGFYTGNGTEMKGAGRLENYYAWEWGDALFMALDPFWTTNKQGRADGNWARTLGAEQFKWLEAMLAGSKAHFKFVFIHHLVGGLDDSGRGGSEAAGLYEWGGKDAAGVDTFKTQRPGWSMPIHQLLVKHKVSAVFHGHDHFYAKQDLDGIVYLMVPQPGNAGAERVRNAAEYGYTHGEILPPSGSIRVSVTKDEAVVDYVQGYKVAHSFRLSPDR